MRLPRPYREAAMLVLVATESYPSAAEVLQVDIGTIKSRVNRGRRLLQVALGEEVRSREHSDGQGVEGRTERIPEETDHDAPRR
jgi:DNA-directed RNA polymerase specialized sigma24 family protein